jgi:hypothetical protein
MFSESQHGLLSVTLIQESDIDKAWRKIPLYEVQMFEIPVCCFPYPVERNLNLILHY